MKSMNWNSATGRMPVSAAPKLALMMAISEIGRVDHALRAEAVDEAFGDFERAAVDADVFADAEDRRIALHLFPDALANGFQIGDCCHGKRF